jgi:hypothetical protein
LVQIGGMSDEVFEVAHGSSGLMSRMGGFFVECGADKSD